MLQIQSFKVGEDKEFNEFVKNHPPRSSEKQSGIVFHGDRAIVIYDDFVVDELNKKNIIYSFYENAIQKLITIEPDIEITKLELEQITPKQYEIGDSRNVLEAKLKRDSWKKEDIDYVLNHMEALQSKLILDTASCDGAKDKIKIYKTILATYDK